MVLAVFEKKRKECDFSSFGANGWVGLNLWWVVYYFPWFNLMGLMLIIKNWTLVLYFMFIVKRRFDIIDQVLEYSLMFIENYDLTWKSQDFTCMKKMGIWFYLMLGWWWVLERL